MYDRELEQLLAEGLGERGAQGGRLGGAATGTPGTSAAGAAGGRTGARFAARLLKTRHHEEHAELAVRPELVWDVVEHLGRGVRIEGDQVRGVIGSGWLNMNPAVVDVRIAPGTVTVRAAAKEGLIPQRSARKAVRRTLEALYSAAPPS